MLTTFRFGLRAPSKGEDIVRDQLRLAHRYRNTLVEIERGRRDAVRDAEARSGLHEALVAVNAARVALAKALDGSASERAASGARKATRTTADAVKSARASLKAALTDFREKRVEIRDSMRAECQRIDALALELRKNARAHSDLYWGTYITVEAAMDQAAKAPLWDGGAPCDPDFVRWTGEGCVAVQVQGGDDANALAGSTLVRLLPATPPPSELARWERKRQRLGDPSWMPREGRDVALLRDLWLRVGSDGSRAPVWAVFSMVLHRPIPDGARVKGVVVKVRRIGTREEWSALLTLDVPEASRAEACGTGAVAVHLGWRAMGEKGIRVAVVLDEHGQREEVFLDRPMMDSLCVADGIEAVRDKLLERARPILAAALRDAQGITGRLAADARTLHAWRSQDRLRGFVRAWEKSGSPGGDALCAEAAAMREHTPEPARSRLPQEDTVRGFALAWERHDRHLCDYAAGQRTGSRRARREGYRLIAARLARRYGALVLDDANRAELARRDVGPTGEDVTIDRASSNRVLAAVSVLEGALKDAFRARGGTAVEVPAAGETITCNSCGCRMVVGMELLVQCGGCHAVWDQDDNAVRNKLDAWRERFGNAETAGATRTEVGGLSDSGSAASKWARRKAAKCEKGGDAEAARNGG